MSQYAVRLKEVTKTYVIEPNEVQALRGVTLDIAPGRLVAITGKSGAGKSTLLQIVGALDSPTMGRVEINGSDISQFNDQQASNFRNTSIGFVFQSSNLLPEFTAEENVMMPGLIAGVAAGAAKERARELLNAVGLLERARHRPNELSGGEQQRVAIARALVMAPPLLLADEPTGNLDNRTSHVVQELLFRLCETHKMTMLLVTHDADLAKTLPGQIEMEDGRMIKGGGLT